jgi:gamma-glutamylputrescine oxidase
MTSEPHAHSYGTAGPEPAAGPSLGGDRRAEVASIGAGYTRLAVAHRLAGTHGLDTVVLEANRIGRGASGRNGGFALITLGKDSSPEERP